MSSLQLSGDFVAAKHVIACDPLDLLPALLFHPFLGQKF